MSKINTVTVVQARMSSTRLAGKVMLDILGKPLLFRQIERMSKAKYIGKIVVATSIEQEDDTIVRFCLINGIACFRGSLTNLLERHYQTAVKYKADIVLKIPSDCPLIDPEVIDIVIEHFLELYSLPIYQSANLPIIVSNLHPGSWPDGNDVEVMNMEALRFAHNEATTKLDREHTTPFMYDSKNNFITENVSWESGLDYSKSHRWTIDYSEDYVFIKNVYTELYPNNPNFNCEDILNLLKQKPEIQEHNRQYAGQYWWNKNDVRSVMSDVRHV